MCDELKEELSSKKAILWKVSLHSSQFRIPDTCDQLQQAIQLSNASPYTSLPGLFYLIGGFVLAL